MHRSIHNVAVYGIDVDAQSRCIHWNSDLDIIAIKFKCCGEWFACFDCHSGHAAKTWPPEEFSEKAVLCGNCGKQVTITDYLASGSVCPGCSAQFNPGCAKHYHLYFG